MKKIGREEVIERLTEIDSLLGMSSEEMTAYCHEHGVFTGCEYAYLTGAAWAKVNTLLENLKGERRR